MANLTPASLPGALREAIALHNAGRLDAADAIYRDVLRLVPRHADALHLRALVAHARGSFADAARLADQAIAVAPKVANFHNTAGDAWRRAGDLAKARKRLAEAVRLDPAMAMAHHNLSLLASADGRPDEARAANRRALELDPAHAEALIHALGLAASADDWEGAARLAAQVEAMREQPAARSAVARYHAQRARRHFRALEFAAGDEAAGAAIAADPQYWAGWALRGEAAFEQLELPRAELLYSVAANLAPDNGDARRNLALILRNQKRLDDAQAHLQAWLAGSPDDADARFVLATVELMRGDYANGWQDYEARWKMPAQAQARFNRAPQWDGRGVSSLLLYAEQGLGDTVQMLRFVAEARRRVAGRLVLQVQPPLLRLAQRVFGSDPVRVVAEIPATRFDAACPLMSLPRALGIGSAERIGCAAYLDAPASRVAAFGALLARHPGRKLGLVWRGAEGSGVNRLRRLPEDALAPLLGLAGWTPVSLQFGVRQPTLAGRALVDLSEEIADFEDLAAALCAVDAVVSLDTGPAHLAGALGVAVHTLLPWLHDWRWGADGARCAWYPKMELHRQPVGGSWSAAVARVAARLGADTATTPAGRPAARTAVAAASSAASGPSAPSALSAPSATAAASATAANPAAAADDGAERAPVLENRFPFVRVKCRHGIFTLPLFDRYITRSMLAYGEYSPREAEVLACYLAPGDTAVDVGANLGTLTLAMAHAVGARGRVVALEPQAMLHRCLVETVAASGVPWVDARRVAAGAAAGVARIASIDAATAANFGAIGLGAGGDGDGEPVERVRVDDLGLAACRLLKIDVEGTELDVLEGAAGLIARHRPVLCVECDRPGSREAIGAFLKRFGYRVFLHEPPLFAGRNFRGLAVDLFPGIVSANLVGLPPGTAGLPDMRPVP